MKKLPLECGIDLIDSQFKVVCFVRDVDSPPKRRHVGQRRVLKGIQKRIGFDENVRVAHARRAINKVDSIGKVYQNKCSSPRRRSITKETHHVNISFRHGRVINGQSAESSVALCLQQITARGIRRRLER